MIFAGTVRLLRILDQVKKLLACQGLCVSSSIIGHGQGVTSGITLRSILP